MIRIEVPWREVAVIRDVEAIESWFDAGELAFAHAFPREKRRQEWMRARVALKLLQREHGALPCASFSHSGAYGAAAVGHEAVGVDVEVVRPLAEKAAHLFLSDEEERAMQGCRIEHRLIHFFCAKEAAWKRAGGDVETLRRIPLRLVSERAAGLVFDGVETFATGDAIVAFALEAVRG